MEAKTMDNIPPFFLCPISLQVMEDPVTISTGVSYDRRSIARWLANHPTCPVTNQRLTDLTLTPNATLLRLIQSWFAGTEVISLAFPVLTNPGLDVSEILCNLRETGGEVKALRKIKQLMHDHGSEAAARMEEAGVTSLVASLITRHCSGGEVSEAAMKNFVDPVDEAAVALHLLKPSPEKLKELAERNNGELIASLSSLLQQGSYEGRVHSALLLRSIFEVVSDKFKGAGLPSDLIEGVVEILKDQNASRGTTMALLAVLIGVLPHGKNRTRALEAGAVAVAVELLMEESRDRRKCEAMLRVLELVCGRAEGRAELVGHPAGVAAVVAKVLSMSTGVTERAVKVLGLVSRCCGRAVVEEMMLVGGVAKLCIVVQVEGSRKSMELAREMLRMHMKEWSKFPCFPATCLP
ncbi:E3 ubiquitin-protein ligase [Canna indica]|uniref:U-box domain-containing protein n=1 Tax=Canna indica TaxID=4628 RepID=A0AAQ3JXW3_9LILI|nr:E3 ubiquitin-protein ligase [Canna indica]